MAWTEGHGFNRAVKVGKRSNTSLPQAGVKPVGRND